MSTLYQNVYTQNVYFYFNLPTINRHMLHGIWTKALPDICPPMKNGMRGHFPPPPKQKELQGWTFAPSLFLLKLPLKNFILAKVVSCRSPGVSIHQTGRSTLSATLYTCCLNMPHDAPCPRPFKVHQHLAQYFDGKRGQNLHPNM